MHLHQVGVGTATPGVDEAQLFRDAAAEPATTLGEAGCIRGYRRLGGKGIHRGVDDGEGSPVFNPGGFHGGEHGRHVHLTVASVGGAVAGEVAAGVTDMKNLAAEGAP